MFPDPATFFEHDFFMVKRGAASALDFPWYTNEDVLDERVCGVASSFDTFAATYDAFFAPVDFKKYEKTGFATPTGKVELFNRSRAVGV